MAGGALDQPYALTQDILELRHFARAIEMVESATKAKHLDDLPDSPMIKLVTVIEFEVAQQERQKAVARRAARRAKKTQ